MAPFFYRVEALVRLVEDLFAAAGMAPEKAHCVAQTPLIRALGERLYPLADVNTDTKALVLR